MSALEFAFNYRQRECLRLSLPNFLSYSLADMAMAAEWVSVRMREKMEVQVLHYADFEGDLITKDSPDAEAFMDVMRDCKKDRQMAVIFDCSIEPRNLTWERRNYRPIQSGSLATITLGNEEHFLKTLQKLEKQQELIRETAQRTLAQQHRILRSYEMKELVGRGRTPSPFHAQPSVPSMTMEKFQKLMVEEAKKESPRCNKSEREIDLIDFMDQLEQEFLQAEVNCSLKKIEKNTSAAFSLQKQSELKDTATLSISKPTTHSVSERMNVARETQTEKKEGKSQETSTEEKELDSDKLASAVERLIIEGKLTHKWFGHREKSGNKREKSPKKESSKAIKKPKKEMMKIKFCRSRLQMGIVKEYALKKVGTLNCKEIHVKKFRVVNLARGNLENVQVKLIRATPDIVEMISGEPPISIDNGKVVKVKVGVACAARRVQPSFASFALHNSSGVICSPEMHVFLPANVNPKQLSISSTPSTIERFLVPIVQPRNLAVVAKPIAAPSAVAQKAISMPTKLFIEAPKKEEERAPIALPYEKMSSKSKWIERYVAPTVSEVTVHPPTIPIEDAVFADLIGDNQLEPVRPAPAKPENFVAEQKIDRHVFENIVDDNVEIKYTIEHILRDAVAKTVAAVANGRNDSGHEESDEVEEEENDTDAWERCEDLLSGSDSEYDAAAEFTDDEGSDFEVIPRTTSAVEHEDSFI